MFNTVSMSVAVLCPFFLAVAAAVLIHFSISFDVSSVLCANPHTVSALPVCVFFL